MIAFARVSLARVSRHAEALASRLSFEERSRVSKMLVHKRAHEHLAGRMAARRALSAAGVELHDVTIGVDEGVRAGAPIALRGGVPIAGVHLSISHGAGSAIAIASTEGPLGIDIERVELRSVEMMEDAFAPGEIERFAHALGEHDPARAATVAWCAKEACAKLAGTGLRAPLAAYEARQVIAQGPAPASRPLSLRAMRPITIVTDELGALEAGVVVRADLAVVWVRPAR